MPEPIVKMRGITKSFLNTKVNDNVDFDLFQGEVHALLGENGAGKTTLMNILSGVYFQDEGDILFKGKNIRYSFPGEALAGGIGMVHQRFSLVNNLTVLENIILGLKTNNFFLNYKKIYKLVEAYSKEFQLEVDPHAFIYDLHVGDRQKVEILKMLVRNVDVLIMDEPTSVLTKQESDHLVTILKKIASTGKCVVFISHKMNEVREVADRITVLRKAQKITTLENKNISNTELARLMVGKDINFDFNREGQTSNIKKLEINNLCVKGNFQADSVHDLSFEVMAGEIFGIAGVSGNGQRELADAIAGLLKTSSGEIILNAQNLSRMSVSQRIEKGVSYIPENRTTVGTAGLSPIWENLIMKVFQKKEFLKTGIMNIKKLKEYALTILKKYDVSYPGLQYHAALLSGGNLQKIILGREIEADKEVYIFMYPSQGLDIGATNFVRTSIMGLRNKGKAVILVSGDLDELFELSDRIAVIYEGEFVKILPQDKFNVETIGLYMSGVCDV